MTADLLEASSEVSRDLSPEWLVLSASVRRLAEEAKAGSDKALAEEALRLCDHVERLHADVEHLLQSLGDNPEVLAGTLSARAGETSEIDRANIQIQREMHQKGDLLHVIKALFMWKDDPRGRLD